VHVWLCLLFRRKRAFPHLLISSSIVRARLRVRDVVFYIGQVFCGWSSLWLTCQKCCFHGDPKHLWRALDVLHVIDCSFPFHSDHIQEYGQVQVKMSIQIQVVKANDTVSIIFHDIFVLVIILVWVREHIVVLNLLWWRDLLNFSVRNVRSRDSCSIR
jgi:hypothetical protein